MRIVTALPATKRAFMSDRLPLTARGEMLLSLSLYGQLIIVPHQPSLCSVQSQSQPILSVMDVLLEAGMQMQRVQMEWNMILMHRLRL